MSEEITYVCPGDEESLHDGECCKYFAALPAEDKAAVGRPVTSEQ